MRTNQVVLIVLGTLLSAPSWAAAQAAQIPGVNTPFGELAQALSACAQTK